MTSELAQKQLAKLKREREVAVSTIAEQQSLITILDVQIAGLEPLAKVEEAAPTQPA